MRRAAPFAALPESALHAVLDMLAGRYPSEEFGELRARITWDRVTDQLGGRPGAQRLAVTSGGTIPDRGLFTVMTPGGADGVGSRVGELDEEMVYESRVGDAIMLGTSSWRVEDITHDRVIVTPAPGVPARLPFWKGEQVGRPLELGRAVGAFVREMTALSDEEARERATGAGLDEWAADNLLAYLREQREATRHVPSDRVILVERFRDELGDWRLVVHSPFGSKVNGPWALAIAARMRERRGVECHAVGRRRRHRAAAARRAGRLGLRGRAHRRGRAARSGRGRAGRGRRAGRVVAVRLAVPRVRGPRPAAAPARSAARARRCGSSGRGRRSCSPWPGATSSSRSPSKRCASACRTSTTCPGCAR